MRIGNRELLHRLRDSIIFLAIEEDTTKKEGNKQRYIDNLGYIDTLIERGEMLDLRTAEIIKALEQWKGAWLHLHMVSGKHLCRYDQGFLDATRKAISIAKDKEVEAEEPIEILSEELKEELADMILAKMAPELAEMIKGKENRGMTIKIDEDLQREVKRYALREDLSIPEAYADLIKFGLDERGN